MYVLYACINQSVYCGIPYKMIYWRGINIGDWWFYAEIANINLPFLFKSEHAQWHMAQNHQCKIRQLNFQSKFTKYNVLLSPINHLVQYLLG